MKGIRMNDQYFLMNKNSQLMLFSVHQDNFGLQYCSKLEQYVDDALLPPGFSSIHDWVEKRNYAKHKLHLRKWLKSWQLDSIKGFLNITHALGLNDSLWVCPAGVNLSWQNVSLYSNPFNDVVAKTAFSKGLQGLQLSSTSPEFTSEGSFEKCWIRQKSGDILLYKKGSEGFANSGLEPYSEFYSSQISHLICTSALSYNLHYFKKHLVSSCKMFTDENNGFVPIYKFLNPSRSYNLSEILAFLRSLGFEEDFRDMIVLDSVILNPDRHLGNFGFIVDNDTFRIKRFAPVFDHNMALAARAMNSSLLDDTEYVKSLGHKLGADFVLAAKIMLTNRTKSILHQMQDFSFYTHTSYNLPHKRLRFLNQLVRLQVKHILS